MKLNDKNDFAKRTANTVNSILSANGIELKAINNGDGNMFYINQNDLKTRILVKKSGFILQRSEQNAKQLYFFCHE